MKELCIESKSGTEEKTISTMEVVVSLNNLISEEKINELFMEIFSSLDSAATLQIDFFSSDCVRIKLEIKSPNVNDLLVGLLEVFLYRLGNVRVYHKKIEYRIC